MMLVERARCGAGPIETSRLRIPRPAWLGGWEEVGAMGLLTTHVLDTSRGIPAAGLLIDLFRLGSKPTDRTHLRTIETSASGHTNGSLIEGDALVPGVYELLFHVGRYF